MEKKMTVAEFAALVGTTSKTIYLRIVNNNELPVNERLNVVKEKVKGREISLIITDLNQIEYYKSLYGNNNVNESEYYENLTDINNIKPDINGNNTVKNNNNSISNSDLFDRLLTLNNEYNDRIQQLNNELITYKSQIPLLEDKASREGLYLNEINELKGVNKKLNTHLSFFKYSFITVIIILLMLITWFVTFNYFKNISEQHPDQNIETSQNISQ